MIVLLIAKYLKHMTPQLEVFLKQADIPSSPEEYISKAVLTSLAYFGLTLLLCLFLDYRIVIPIAAAVGIFNYIALINRPRIIVMKRVRDIEKNLYPALSHILLRVKSGIPLFSALRGVAEGNFGELSKEMQYVVRRIESGETVVNALEYLAMRNPSTFLRRVMWQISSGLTVGGDISKTLESIANNISRERMIQIRKYGSELNPLSLMYMLFSVVVPSLTIVLIIVLSMFLELPFGEAIFYLIPLLILVIQIMFLSIMKAKRPTLMR